VKPSMAALGWALLAFAASDAFAQRSTSVQLPTFSFFSASTTVSVPDGGNAYIGGVNRASSGGNQFGSPLGGPFRNSSIGSQAGASSMRVTAQIHDFEAMDEYLLGQPGASRPLGAILPQGAAALGMTLRPRRPAPGPIWSPPPAAESPLAASLADADARRSSHDATRRDEARDFFERARKAEAEGKSSVAKVYYQMAARRATGQLKDQVLARLEALSARGASQVARSP
jgi:hypothetical protein